MAEQIEVYQSQHSAQQIEDAMGAVLSIGENGNWWIGDNDTGVFAGGVKVTGAKPGQTIVVNAVDSEGMPTSWKAADTPDVWRIIADITLSENVVNVYVNKDMDGKEFALKEVRINVFSDYVNSSGATVTNLGVRGAFNAATWSWANNYFAMGSLGNVQQFHSRVYSDRVVTSGIYSGGAKLQNVNNTLANGITTILLATEDTTNGKFAAGGRIIIEGVNKYHV